MSSPAPKHPVALPAIALFEYLDYRAFLRDSYRARKRANPAFSYRYIGGRLGLDGGSVAHILKGERKLDPALAGKLARVFGLDEREREYFETLVLFGQARSQTEQNHFLEKLLRQRELKVKAVEERQYAYYREWFHLGLRELLNFYPFKGDFKALARMLQPAISPAEARSALQVLLDIGLLERDAEDKVRLTDKNITSGDGIPSRFVVQAQRAMAELAAKALAEVPPPERDISGITCSLSCEGFEKFKARLKECRRDLVAIAQQDKGVDRVYRMNLQLFPISRSYWPARESD